MKMWLMAGVLASVAGMAMAAQEKAPEPMQFPANARVVLDEYGVPQQVQANEKLPVSIRQAIEQRILQWRFEPARINGQAKPGITHVWVDACLIPLANNGMAVGMDYNRNGPAYADNALRASTLYYPPPAARMGAEGTFRVSFKIGEDGRATVESIKELKGELRPFKEAIQAWMKVQRYVPEQVDGRPIATHASIMVLFSMEGGRQRKQLERQEQQRKQTAPECQAVDIDGGGNVLQDIVLDSPFKPITTI